MTGIRTHRSSKSAFITPDWPLAGSVKAASTTRIKGLGEATLDSNVFSSFNLGGHVGDAHEQVASNRAYLASELVLPAAPVWLEQVHAAEVLELSSESNSERDAPIADAAITSQAGLVCAVMTADCLPLLLTNIDGSRVAAVHAGWRSMAAGIIEKAIVKMRCAPEEILAWAGPCIGREAFEVGEEVREQLGGPDSAYFPHQQAGKVYADLVGLAKHRLAKLGVSEFYSANRCTFTEAEYFFSYRRDGQTGRMATLIWID